MYTRAGVGAIVFFTGEIRRSDFQSCGTPTRVRQEGQVCVLSEFDWRMVIADAVVTNHDRPIFLGSPAWRSLVLPLGL